MSYVGPPSRDEQILKAILGEGIVDFEPQSRIEALLYRIYEEGGVGGGGAKLKGYYDTVAELEAAHPTGDAGDAYLVGNPSHIYTWLVDDQEWHDGGAFTAVPGPEGVGIASIEKTSTVGLVDTYTVTYTDGDTDTFTVTNGAEGVGIVSIEKTATVGLVDTYTITLSDGNTYDFTVTNGSGGSGVPEGGTTGQVLAKKSDADGDVEWVNQSGGSNFSSEIASLSAATSELASETTVLASENSTRTSEINSLSTENSAQSSEISSLSESMSELASTVSSESTAQSEVDSIQNSSLASLSTENSTQTSEISSLSTASSEMASQVAELGSEVIEKQPMLTEGAGIDIASDNTISTEVKLFTGTLQEWEALTLAEKQAFTHAAITNDKYTGNVDAVPTEDSPNLVTSGGVYKNSSFSTSEIETSIEFNGKKVYRRTFRGYVDTYVTYSDLRQFNAVLMSSGVEEVINAYGMIEYDQNTYEYQIPSIAFKANGALAHTTHIRYHATDHSVSLMSESLVEADVQRMDYVVTLEYTKTN